MSTKYLITCNGHSVELTQPNKTIIIYKILYSDLVNKRIGFNILNKFVVYILFGRNEHGKDVIYVGESTNGIYNRPTSHDDLYDKWTYCYILTQYEEGKFFNDGLIQYLEDKITKRVAETKLYKLETKKTSSNTANENDEMYCDEYLESAYEMLEILGLDLNSNTLDKIAEEEVTNGVSSNDKVPDGIYKFSRRIKKINNNLLEATMEVKDGKYILKQGSQITDVVSASIVPSIEEIRNNAQIVDGILQKDIETNSPSACLMIAIAMSCNGWSEWKNSNGEPIDIYRHKK